MKSTSHMSATAALAWTKVCRQRVKMIAAQNPARLEPKPPPQAKMTTAVSAAATRGREAGGKRIFPEGAEARDLEPIGERRFVETVAIVEIGHDIIAALDHLARGLRKTRLIAIDQRQRPGAGEMKKQTPTEESREIASCRLQESDSKMAGAEKQPANSRCIKSRRSGNGCFIIVLAVIAIAAAFHFDARSPGLGDRSFQSHCETVHAQRQPLRRLAGAHRGRFTSRRDRLVARKQTLGPHWPNDDPRLRPRRHRRARAQDRDRPRAALRSNKNSAGTARGSARNTIHSRADTLPRRLLSSASSSSPTAASRSACCRSRSSSPPRACMSRRILFRCDVRRDPRNSVRVVLRPRIPSTVKRRRRQPPCLNHPGRLRAGAEFLFPGRI